jgi:hypothetical protein
MCRDRSQPVRAVGFAREIAGDLALFIGALEIIGGQVATCPCGLILPGGMRIEIARGGRRIF